MQIPDQIVKIRAERGYTLSYHEIFARTEPKFLDAYTQLYRSFTLDSRYLSSRERELIWAALLTADEEKVGTLHLERGFAAGVTAAEMGEAIAIAGAAASWQAVAFAAEYWSPTLQMDAVEHYGRIMMAAAPHLSNYEVDLAAMVVQAVHQNAEPFLYHMERLYSRGAEDKCVAEAVSYLLLPCGANAMLWATDVWLEAIASNRIRPSGDLLDVNTDTRRS